jgi:6-phosphogluconolactonase
VFDSSEALANGAAEWLCAKALASTGRFAVCCSGGSTPRRMYELLARPDIKSRFPWGRVHWFWGDERFVLHDDPDSNYGMTRAALLSHVDVPAGNIHPVSTSDRSPEQAAAEYERTLKDYYGADDLRPGRPLFDVTFLGIGEDGHTASLFPGHPALDEKRRWALAIVGARPQARITLTYPALDSSGDVVFLAAGSGKRAIVARARAGDHALPAAGIKPVGNLRWFIDRAVAG